MPIPRHLKLFELKLVRERNKIEIRGIRLAHAALVKQYMTFIDKLPYITTRDNLAIAADSINSDEIESFLKRYYGMFAPVGLMYRKNAISQKSVSSRMQYKASEDVEYLSLFQRYLQSTLNGEAGKSITTITGTSQNKIKSIIRNILSEDEFAGEGIEKIASRIRKSVGENLRGNGWARSRAIAQTEMIKASNQAAFYAVDSTGMDFRKYWSTSHLEGIRPTHSDAELESIEKKGLRKEEKFANGLLFPGDPAGSAAEVINCRCSLLQEIV